MLAIQDRFRAASLLERGAVGGRQKFVAQRAPRATHKRCAGPSARTPYPSGVRDPGSEATRMSRLRKTAIVTGASQGIGAGIVKGFVERGFDVVANSRKVSQSTEVAASDHVALVDGHVGEPETAARIVQTALARFGYIDALVNNAGIFFTKPFTDYTAEDFRSLVS